MKVIRGYTTIKINIVGSAAIHKLSDQTFE
jgi:hypothetical protein